MYLKSLYTNIFKIIKIKENNTRKTYLKYNTKCPKSHHEGQLELTQLKFCIQIVFVSGKKLWIKCKMPIITYNINYFFMCREVEGILIRC